MARKAYAQVYSLIRHDRSAVLLEALKTFSRLGYEGVEGIGANSGGLPISEFKAYLSELGLDMCSVMSVNNEEEWSFAAQVGARYGVADFGYESVGRDDILRACDRCNEVSRRMKSFGLMNLIHNHATEYEWVDGKEGGTRIYDLLVESTDSDCVGFELDVGWTMFGGVDPADCVKKHPGRFPVIHVKECGRIAASPEEREHFPKKVLELGPPRVVDGGKKFSPLQEQMMYEARNFNCELGRGIIDWQSLTEAVDAQGIQTYFVNEREYYHCYGSDGDKVLCAEKDCEFIHAL